MYRSKIKTNNIRSFYTAIAFAASSILLSACAGYSITGGSYDDGYGNPVAPRVSAVKKVEVDSRFGGPIAVIDTAIGEVMGGGANKLALYYFDKDEGTVPNVMTVAPLHGLLLPLQIPHLRLTRSV